MAIRFHDVGKMGEYNLKSEISVYVLTIVFVSPVTDPNNFTAAFNI